jgi:O-antigen ligase
MQNPAIDRLRTWLTADDLRLAVGSAIGVAVLAGLVLGALLGWLGPLVAIGLLGVLAAGLVLLRSTEWSLIALLALICLLPYAAVPVDIGFKPTFIDLALLAVLGGWLLRAMTGARRTSESPASPKQKGTSLGIPVFAFLLWTVITFVAGLAYAPVTATVLRRFAEVLLAVSLCLVVVNQVRRLDLLRRATTVIVLAGGVSGFLGVLFYILPGDWTVSILSRLAVFNYPAGAGILRFVEDDPNQPMRAIGTSIDPNALGGLLVIVTAVAVVQLFASQPVLRRRWLAPLAGVMALCLLLTYSRGSMIGLAIGVALAGALRYRKLLILLAALAVLMLILPPTQGYVTRLVEGLQGQDLATQMRFGEYKDAFILISRYPVLGVGFTGTPDIDLYVGVSSLYLLIAEQIGLVGLFLFIVVVATCFVVTLRAWRRLPPGHPLEGDLLGYQAALAGALVGGVFDHFFFNINFIHLVALFWVVVGLAVAAARLVDSTAPVRPTTRDGQTRQ